MNKKKKKTYWENRTRKSEMLLLFPGSVPGQSDPGLGPVIGLRSQVEKVWSCYCCAFFIRASASWRKETETEGGKEGAEGESAVLKWRIFGSCILCHRTQENPSVSMGTGTTPCSSYRGREEAPVCWRERKGRRRLLYYVISVFSVWKSCCEDKYVFRYISQCYRKHCQAVGMLFRERTHISVCFCVH